MLWDKESLAREYKRSNSPINDALQKNWILRLSVSNQ